MFILLCWCWNSTTECQVSDSRVTRIESFLCLRTTMVGVNISSLYALNASSISPLFLLLFVAFFCLLFFDTVRCKKVRAITIIVIFSYFFNLLFLSGSKFSQFQSFKHFFLEWCGTIKKKDPSRSDTRPEQNKLCQNQLFSSCLLQIAVFKVN